jgi:FKBP-type peptidyl-prolyl cis-trans isomerase
MTNPLETPPPPPAEKQNPPPPSLQFQPKLVNLVILAFLAYAAYQYFMNPQNQAQQKSAEMETIPYSAEEAKNKADAPRHHPEDPLMDRLNVQERFNSLTGFLPSFRSGVRARTLIAGEGRAAYCGQTAEYTLQKKGETAVKNRTQQIGEFSTRIEQYLGWGLVGMREGETRELRIPQKTAEATITMSEPTDIEIYTVTLKRVTPAMPQAGEMPLRRFMLRGEAPYDFRCGDVALFHLSLRDAAGKLVFTTLGQKPIFTTLGAGAGIPLGLELALQEMGPGGEYTVIIPPELAMPLAAERKAPLPPEGVEAQLYPAEWLKPQTQVLIADIQIPRRLSQSD